MTAIWLLQDGELKPMGRLKPQLKLRLKVKSTLWLKARRMGVHR